MALPEHLKRDMALHAQTQAYDLIIRHSKVFSPSPEALGIIAESVMMAGFLALYTAAKMLHPSATARDTLHAWVENKLESDLEAFDKSFTKAKEQFDGHA